MPRPVMTSPHRNIVTVSALLGVGSMVVFRGRSGCRARNAQALPMFIYLINNFPLSPQAGRGDFFLLPPGPEKGFSLVGALTVCNERWPVVPHSATAASHPPPPAAPRAGR